MCNIPKDNYFAVKKTDPENRQLIVYNYCNYNLIRDKKQNAIGSENACL